MNNRATSVSLLLVLLVAAGCGRNRFDYIDLATSEKAFHEIRDGFMSVPDSVRGGRTAYLSSLGVPVADVLVFRGGQGDSTAALPEVPYGYSCTVIGPELLQEGLHVKAKRLYSESGYNARVLYLQDNRMSLETLSAIAALASGGAFIGGVKPSVCLDGDDNPVFNRTVEKTWLSGNVMSGKTLKSILKAAGVRPDIKTKADSLSFSHRRLDGVDIYRVCNDGHYAGKVKVRFRTRGREPLQWNPDTGEIQPVSYKIRKRTTRVTFETVPGDDTFIIFASLAEKRKLKVKK